MTSARSTSKVSVPPGNPAPGRAPLHVADFVLPVSLGLWALGIGRTNVAAIGPDGLPAALPVIFYVGVALLVVSAATELARERTSVWRMSVHAVALVIMLYGTAPLVYPEGRYSWFYKTIGVVQYVNAHGQLNRHIDIYQNWPGFFALAAWFGKVAGVASPLSYAKWAQLAFELAALPLLYLAYDALSLSVRQRWLALLLYSGSNWIGQDYFSPQALGMLLGLGVMALAMRWLYVDKSSGRGRLGRASPAEQPDRAHSSQLPSRAIGRGLSYVTIGLIYFVLTFAHELTPYILAVQLGALAVARRLRPRWLPIALAAIAVGYLLPRFSFVNSHYGLLAAIGNFFTNALPPAFRYGAVPASQQLIERSAEALSAGIWLLALIGLWLRRRPWSAAGALAILAFSPIVVLVLVGYGQEGILRVFLFSLPWTAALAAMTLAPVPALADVTADHPAPGTAVLGVLRSWRTWRPGLALGVAVALFFPAFFGDDGFNAMPSAEVATVTSFLRTARAGPLYCAIDNAPLADTGRYDLFPLTRIFGSYSMLGATPATSGIASRIAADAVKHTHAKDPAYVVVTPSMIAYNQAYGVTPARSFTILLAALAHSPRWKLIVHRAGVWIYELPPTLPSAAAR